MKSLHLWPKDPKDDGEMVTAEFVLEGLDNRRVEIWYRFPSKYKYALTESCEPYVTSALFAALGSGRNLMVHGRVSPTLLANLEELQGIWVSWKPEKYRRFDIQV